MEILVTGSSGFLGSHLCRALEEKGHRLTKLTSKNCDLTDQNALSKFLASKHGRFGQIFHLAAWTQAGDFCLHHPGEQWIINQKINTSVLSYWHEFQPQAKLIFMGTSCSYDPALELKEENYMAGVPIESLFTYAMTKRMLYCGAKAISKQWGHKYLCLVPSTLYGPGYHTDGRQMHFIFDLIRKILRGKLYGERVVLWGNGQQKRELVHVGDFVSLLITLSGTRENDVINIGAGEEYSIREFSQLICRRVGFDFGKIEFDTSKYVGAKSKCLRVEKLRRIVPGYKMMPLEEGLKGTIEWFMANKSKVLKK
ncbi:NAD-dependent epimerase/dehydratase family protein [Candidatus Parvarchaeota archaeon]|nr:NAD-dependent epimerase/dehydratase family protein [Candidatus Parvarchaeota archaeon]